MWSYTWEQERQLTKLQGNSGTWNFTYDASGLHTGRNTLTTQYRYWYNDSGLLLRMGKGSTVYSFTYDPAGRPVSISDGNTRYYYVLNQQGDVVGLMNGNKKLVVEYYYDAWGRLIKTNGDLVTTLGANNPLRYRGYVYDTETGLYYLQSRYYNPTWGRFISADSVLPDVGGNVQGYNLFAYCWNNPVNYSDQSGNWPSWITKVIIGAAVITAAAILTVATAGTGTTLACFAAGALKGATVGAAMGAFSGAATGAITHRITTGSWEGAGRAALEGAADGFMSGAITGFITGGLTSDVCFVAGTPVLASTGYVAIETIKAGESVWASNPETGEVALKQVVRTFVNEATELIHVTVKGEEIVCTTEHPFYSPIKGWTAACKLGAGDILVTVNGEYVLVEKVQHEILESPVNVYNFEVKDFHTYYVSGIAVLVHNLCHNNQKTTWDINKYSKGQQKVSFSGKSMTAQFDGKYYRLDDLAGHGTSQYKVFQKSRKYLEWVADADEYGNFIMGKHKSSVGMRIKL